MPAATGCNAGNTIWKLWTYWTYNPPQVAIGCPACLISEGRWIIEPRTDRQEKSVWRNNLGIDPIATLKISNDC
jgi:hypothetical protein